MKPDRITQSNIRSYLLGQVDEAEHEAIETAILTDNELFEELLVVEDEVIDEYLNGKLDPEARSRFENYFLAAPERHEQLRFARVFDQYVSSQTAAATAPPSASHSWRDWFQTLFASPVRVAAYAIVPLVIALAAWQIFFRQSDVQKGLVALNSAYREQRPIEARISSLEYAPFPITRGSATDKVNQNELSRAELTLLETLKNNPSSAAHHALGKVYLAKREFDKAIEQFDAAIKGDSNNAQLYSDLGAAWLEKGKLNRDDAEPGKRMAELGRSLENLNKALGMNPNLLEALFNRALCQEQLTVYSQAENDWREYLKQDSTSPWAEEARRKLQLLEEQKKREAQTKDGVGQVSTASIV